MGLNTFQINKGITFAPQATAPSSPVSGDYYYDSVYGSFSFYQTGFWHNLASRDDVASGASLTSANFTAAKVQNTFLRVTGSTAGTIHGLTASSSAKAMVIYNVSSASQTIANQSATEGTATNRIITGLGADFTLASGSSASFVYDSSQSRWIMTSSAGANVTLSNLTSPTVVNQPLNIPNGSVTVPSLAFSSDVDGSGTGLYRLAANSMGFSANGVAIGNYASTGLWTLGPAAGGVGHLLNGTLGFNTVESSAPTVGITRTATSTLAFGVAGALQLSFDTTNLTADINVIPSGNNTKASGAANKAWSHTWSTDLKITNGSTSNSTTIASVQTADRTWTLQDLDDTFIGRLSTDTGANRIKNKDMEAGTMKIVDSADTTKKIAWDASGSATARTLTLAISTATSDKTLTFPNFTDTLAVLAGAQSFTNKTLDNTNTITLKDTLFTLQDDGDTSKQLRFQLSGITTATTRTLTVPDANTTILGTDNTATVTNKTLDNTNTITLKDTLFTLQDDGDITKQLKFQLSGITTATTRTLTAPDANTTILGTDNTAIVTNKTISRASNTLSGFTANAVLIADASGFATSESVLANSRGGTGFGTYATGDILYASATNTLSKLTAGAQYTMLRMGASIPAWSLPTTPTVSIKTSGSAATYTTPAGVQWLRIRMCGGGGGGTGAGSTDGGSQAAGASSIWATAADVAISTAAGGSPGGYAAAGGSGGVVTFAGGTGVTNIKSYDGGGGQQGYGFISLSIIVPGGTGGTNTFEGGGRASVGGVGNPSANSGAGGCGGGQNSAVANTVYSGSGGGAGAYSEFLIAPTAGQQFHYTVGGGGAAGAAGGAGGGVSTAGGAGAGGVIIIEEHYQ